MKNKFGGNNIENKPISRIRGIILLKKGYMLQEIANIMGVNRRTV